MSRNVFVVCFYCFDIVDYSLFVYIGVGVGEVDVVLFVFKVDGCLDSSV